MLSHSLSKLMGLTNLKTIILCQVEIFDHISVEQEQQIKLYEKDFAEILIHKQQQQTRQSSHIKLECTACLCKNMKIKIGVKVMMKYTTLLPFKLTYCVEHIEYSLGHNDDSNIIHVSIMSMMINHLPN